MNCTLYLSNCPKLTQNLTCSSDYLPKTQGDFKICRVYENNALLVCKPNSKAAGPFKTVWTGDFSSTWTEVKAYTIQSSWFKSNS